MSICTNLIIRYAKITEMQRTQPSRPWRPQLTSSESNLVWRTANNTSKPHRTQTHKTQQITKRIMNNWKCWSRTCRFSSLDHSLAAHCASRRIRTDSRPARRSIWPHAERLESRHSVCWLAETGRHSQAASEYALTACLRTYCTTDPDWSTHSDALRAGCRPWKYYVTERGPSVYPSQWDWTRNDPPVRSHWDAASPAGSCSEDTQARRRSRDLEGRRIECPSSRRRTVHTSTTIGEIMKIHWE